MLRNKEMWISISSSLVFFTIIFSLLHVSSYAAKQSYIVYLGEPSDPPAAGPGTIFDDQKLVQSHYDFLASATKSSADAVGTNVVQNDIIYSYSKSMNGFAAFLDDAQVEQLRRNPDVKSVFPNRKYELHTTQSWNFLGLENKGATVHGSIWATAKYGQDVIIGNLDTGVWPESKSFSDEGIGPVPKRWRGTCQTDGNFKCNKKLIGARFFSKGHEAAAEPLNKTMLSARDFEGHGSHTLSTAGGSFVPGASIFGNGKGTAKGGSPHARVAAYKVCWEDGCYGADILAGFDAAIKDGVDVLSVSLGGMVTNFYDDGTAIGAFHAIKKGIVVVASAGNSGPYPTTVENVAPWFLTVAASTMDREFSSSVILGNKLQFKGQSLSDKALPARKFYPLINAATAAAPNATAANASLCEDQSLDPAKVKGKIVVCLRGDNARVGKGIEAARAGAVGMILANDEESGAELLADPHFLPATHISFKDGQAVYNYINTTKNPTASIDPVRTVTGVKPSPAMAAFSSRGPSPILPGILKPDITAPGVNVLAAYSEALSPTEEDFDKRRVPYMIMSGTSMSCPHVSGIVGLLKSIHPDWSPAAIKSAIMTTATTRANDEKTIGEADGSMSTPFAYGAGQARPNSAADPGLVYDMTVNDYLNSLCSLGYNSTVIKTFAHKTYKCPKNFQLVDLNYPSITVHDLKGQVIVNRKVKNVGSPGTYTAQITAPVGVSVTVEPKQLAFAKVGEEKKYKLTFKSTVAKSQNYTYGELIWSDGKHDVRSPIVVKLA